LVTRTLEAIGHLVGGQAEQSHFAGLLKDLVDREMPLENEIAAVLNLVDGVSAAQVDGLAVFFRKLGAEKPTPVVQSFLDNGSAQPVGRRL
jgi:hypothetical protein